MPHVVGFDPQAVDDLDGIRAYERRAILDTVNRILTTTPTRLGKSRIKRLRGTDSPEYRLRVGEFRVFYDVHEDEVYILRVLSKAATERYLKEFRDDAEDD